MRKLHEKDLDELTQQAEEWKNKYFRAIADYQNLLKNIGAEKEKALEIVLKKFIPVLDALDLLQEHKKDPDIEAVRKEIHYTLQGYGLESKSVEGQKFNPHTMECIETTETIDQDKDNEVAKAHRKLYLGHDKVLRPAQVTVFKLTERRE